MRLRFSAPSATHTVSFNDDATIGDLSAKVTELTSLIFYEIKLGFPPRPLDLTSYPTDMLLRDLPVKLDGEKVIIVSKDLPGTEINPSAAASEPVPSNKASATPQQPVGAGVSTKSQPSLTRKPNDMEKGPPEVPIPSYGSRLILRVMPDDNSCLFRSLGLCILGNTIDSMTELRDIVASTIQNDPETYSDVVLQRPRDEYCRWIKHPDSWGGYVDTKAIAEHFQIEVVTIDVQSGTVTRFFEGSQKRCYIIYSGIHYDALALIPEGLDASETEFDQRQFDSDDDEILKAAKEIAKVLKDRHYFTDTAGFSLKCEQCGWTGNGEKAAEQHNTATGHSKFTELT
jgi:ubiquitin thioesterase OTU1